MPYCPRCRQEFQEWVRKCLDCGAPLVSQLPAEPSELQAQDDLREQDYEPPEDLVHVGTAHNELEATIWTDILRQQGIRCMMADARIHSQYRDLMRPDLRIMVRARDAEAAKEILESLQKAAPETQAVESSQSYAEEMRALETRGWRTIRLAVVLWAILIIVVIVLLRRLT